MEAADEIGLAVVATTMAIVVVFVPVSLMTGVVGQYFKQFGLTVAVAVLASLLVARLLTPLLAAYFLPPRPACGSESRLLDRYCTLCAGHCGIGPRCWASAYCASSARSPWCRCCRPASCRRRIRGRPSCRSTYRPAPPSTRPPAPPNASPRCCCAGRTSPMSSLRSARAARSAAARSRTPASPSN